MQSTEITFDNLDRSGGLFTEFLRARYHHFIEARGWDLPNIRGLEFDQYDTPESIYCAIHDGPAVYGGFRVTPTTARSINASYMLRDAQLGLLPGLPADVLDDPAPQDPRIWEVSRVFVDDTLGSRDRMRVRQQLGVNFARVSRERGIASFLCLTSVTAALLTRRSGACHDPGGGRGSKSAARPARPFTSGSPGRSCATARPPLAAAPRQSSTGAPAAASGCCRGAAHETTPARFRLPISWVTAAAKACPAVLSGRPWGTNCAMSQVIAGISRWIDTRSGSSS